MGSHYTAECVQEAGPSGTAVASRSAVGPSVVAASQAVVVACMPQIAAVGCCCAPCCLAGIHSGVLEIRSAVAVAGVPLFVGVLLQRTPFLLH